MAHEKRMFQRRGGGLRVVTLLNIRRLKTSVCALMGERRITRETPFPGVELWYSGGRSKLCKHVISKQIVLIQWRYVIQRPTPRRCTRRAVCRPGAGWWRPGIVIEAVIRMRFVGHAL